MKPAEPDPSAATRTAAAAAWVMRLDRGLGPAEQDDYLHWLAADPRNAAALARQRRAWECLDRLAGLHTDLEGPPDPDLLGPPRRRARKRAWLAVTLPLAVAGLALWPGRPVAPPPALPPAAPPAAAAPAPIEERRLGDGSTLRLNRGAAVAEAFSPAERRVRLERGEAAFTVARDPERPFVVEAGGVRVRAVGTAFNVRRSEEAVEVIVTEGRVAVARAGGEEGPEVRAGERAVVPAAGAPRVHALSAEEEARRLAWQPRPLSFSDEPLAVILAEFNRHNPVALRAGEPPLGELRLSARFRSDNVAGFLRLLEAEFGIRGTPGPAGEITLRRADAAPRGP